ncbi:MAG TPA: S9 family peptidase [Candidatus Angelobacter sp.]|nr:S9 family peptidase [Candidatus Angelobacter sp.]
MNFYLKLCFAALLMAVCRQSTGAEMPLIPRSILFGNPQYVSPRISPDGKLLAYLAPSKGVMNVWVRTVGKTDDRAITKDHKRGIYFFQWQQDSQAIIYRQDQDGDENWHFYQIALEIPVTRDLTPFVGVRAELITVSPPLPNEILVGMNMKNPELFDVYRIQLQTGAVTFDTKNPGNVVTWIADSMGRVRAAVAEDESGGSKLLTREPNTQEWRETATFSADETEITGGTFTQQDRHLMVKSSLGANTARLVDFDLATGKQSVIAEDPVFDVEDSLFDPIRRKLQAVGFYRERREWKVLDPSFTADFEALKRLNPGDFRIENRDQKDQIWIVRYDQDVAPPVFYLYNRATRMAEMLFSSAPELSKYTLASVEPFTFQARDGMRLYGYATHPPGARKGPLPTVMLVHDGPWGRDRWGFYPAAQWLANRGYVVLQVNFRGSTGYGKAYLNAGDREWGGKMHTDILDAKQWAVAQGYTDPQKTCIMGDSYGGYEVLIALAFSPHAFACGIESFGPSDLNTLVHSFPPYWKPEIAMFHKRVGNESTEPDFLRARSPLSKAQEITAPLLIVQGANDVRVKKSESDQIVASLRQKGKPVQYLVMPNEGHGFFRPGNRLKFYAAAENFLATYLGGRIEAPAQEENWQELVVK